MSRVPSGRSVPLRVVASVLLALTAACDLPTDGSGAVGVRFADADVQMIVGEVVTPGIRFEGSSRLSVRDVRFTSLDPSIVQVADGGRFTALGTGETRVVASLRAYETAEADTLDVRVIANLTFESVTPVDVAYGDLVTVRGLALDPMDLEALAVGGIPVRVESFEPRESGDPTARDVLRFWVPAGAAPRSSLVGLHRTGATANRLLTIRSEDLFEPNDDTPIRISDPHDLDNPELAFERGRGYDWYRLTDLDEDVTLEVQLRMPIEAIFADLTLAAPTASRDEVPEWSYSPGGGGATCRGLELEFPRAYYVDEDATDAWLSFPIDAGGLDSLDVIIKTYSPPTEDLRYAVRVLDGFRSPVAPDAFEPNDHCAQAAELPDQSVSLTTHGPADFDWFRFTVDEPSLFRASLVCTGTCGDPPAFFNLNLFRDTDQPDATGALPLLEEDWSGPGGEARVERLLEPGEYFLTVHNYFLEIVASLQLSTSLTPTGAPSR